jgi:hypothetical protein
MGAKSSSMVFPESRYYSILDYGYCKVWKRNDTHKETMEQYDVTIDSLAAASEIPENVATQDPRIKHRRSLLFHPFHPRVVLRGPTRRDPS